MTLQEKITKVEELQAKIKPLQDQIRAEEALINTLLKQIQEDKVNEYFRDGITIENAMNYPDVREPWYSKVNKFLANELPGVRHLGYYPVINQMAFTIDFDIALREGPKKLTLEEGIRSVYKVVEFLKPYKGDISSDLDGYKIFEVSTHEDGVVRYFLRVSCDDHYQECSLIVSNYGRRYTKLKDFNTVDAACRYIWESYE